MNKQRLVDRAKTSVFSSNNAGFFGTLLCKLNWEITEKEDDPIACTNGVYVKVGPLFFNVSEDMRKTIVRHELEHVARMHMLRRGNRNPRTWNYACDMVINRGLVKENYVFDKNPDGSMKGVHCPSEWDDLAEEQIYDLIKPEDIPEDYDGDIGEGTPSAGERAQILGNVAGAINAAKLNQNTGTHTSDYEELIKRLTKVKVDWKIFLQHLLVEKSTPMPTWKKRNRRFRDIYMKGKLATEDALAKIVFFEDVSGSVGAEELAQANAEAYAIKKNFRPKEMRIVQFDTTIKREIVVEEADELNEFKIVGRGGTSLRPVREWILKNKPKVAVIFSDLECEEMEPIPAGTELIWVIVGSGINPPFGRYVHIEL